jgi:YD repeat-containing protein
MTRTEEKEVGIAPVRDLIDKVGGWDETLGKFGAECGNGFAALRNKTFVRLVVVPVDVVTPGSGSCYGTRYWRELPTNISATNANPIVPVAAAAIEAGREFRSGANRVRVAMRVVFSNAPAYLSALDGAVTNAAAAATQTFDAASGDFVVNGVMVGDLLVVGSLNAPSGANLTNAGTYRITAITDADTLVVEKLDGTNFAWTTGTALAWRIHPAAAGDSAGSVGTASVALSGVAGYVVPARPLTATVAAATLLTPAVAPAANSGSAWDTLAGLTGRTHPSGALTYDANGQRVLISVPADRVQCVVTASYPTHEDFERDRERRVEL